MLGVGQSGPTGMLAAAADPASVTSPPRALRPRPITERQAWAILVSVSGLGPVGFGALLRRFGTGIEILESALRPGAERRLVAAGVTDDRETFNRAVAQAIISVAEEPRAVLKRVELPGVDILTTEDPAYPRRLLAIELPPPCPVRPGRRRHALGGARGGGRRNPSAVRSRPGHRLADRRRAGDGRGGRRVRSRGRDRRGEPRRGDGRRAPDRGRPRLGSRSAVPASAREAGRPDRRRRRRSRLGARPGHPPEPELLPAPQPPDQRPDGRDRRGRGRREERRADHRRLGARAGPRAVPGAWPDRRAGVGRLPGAGSTRTRDRHGSSRTSRS